MRAAWLPAHLLLAAAASAQERPLQEPLAEAPRGRCFRWTSPQGRPYEWRLPETIDAARPPNLLVLTYGTGMGYQWAFANYPAAEGWRKDDILVAPEAKEPRNGFFQAKPDETEILDLIKLFQKRFPVGNVYLYGHSQGAFFTYWFGGEHPDVVDGIIGHAGRPLNFKFPKDAAERQAVGILHATADPVVTVWCAFDADRRYREHGYRNVKLFVVEGLPEHAGHWPLPWHVNEMLDWVDRTSLASLPWAAHLVARELGKATPDLAAVADIVRRGRELAKKHKGDDRDALLQRLDVAAGFLERALGEHAQALAAAILENAKEPAHGAWAVHFALAREAFGGMPAFEEAAKPLQKHLAKHEKELEKSSKHLLVRRSGKTMAAGLDAMDGAFLARGYEHFLVHLKGYVDKPGDDKPPTSDELAAYQGLVKKREPDREKGRAAADAITSRLAAELREDHDWIPKPPEPSGG
jgi:pimeloyl-ACP methyl ester carboxylesterase